ncbi:hypothetical protein F5X68DRAFT_233194 [Plectosphaerella plurivora]|uniref:Protein kinase domain-containing protein n=1 Tax=Plectosphaerella plurivora TaxID=936078 RepID=A0A9P8VAG3_9PEZI|nr:hypothetical protein F5X68DRAFT_233194 [Plectosphaerella plurivora]
MVYIPKLLEPPSPRELPELEPMPPCEGPKLEPFTNDLFAHDVEFLDADFAGADFCGRESPSSEVYKVTIDGKLYCLKVFIRPNAPVFRPTRPHPDTEVLAAYVRDQPRDVQALLWDQTVSFYNECRAYGRLKEANCEHLAGKAYGYVTFNGRDKRFYIAREACRLLALHRLSIFGEEKMWDSTEWERRSPMVPYFGIVKEWLGDPEMRSSALGSFNLKEKDRNATAKDMPRMLRELHQLHKIGIVHRNLSIYNYMAGRLCSFSSAWTIPHAMGPDGGILPSWAFSSMASWDLWCFQVDVVVRYNYWAAECNDEEDRTERIPLSRIRFYPDPPMLRLRNGAQIAAVEETPRHGMVMRPRPMNHGPLLPLIDGDVGLWNNAFVVQPKYDPSKYDWKSGDETKWRARRRPRVEEEEEEEDDEAPLRVIRCGGVFGPGQEGYEVPRRGLCGYLTNRRLVEEEEEEEEDDEIPSRRRMWNECGGYWVNVEEEDDEAPPRGSETTGCYEEEEEEEEEISRRGVCGVSFLGKRRLVEEEDEEEDEGVSRPVKIRKVEEEDEEDKEEDQEHEEDEQEREMFRKSVQTGNNPYKEGEVVSCIRDEQEED